jgi:hypothetical protein
MGKVCTHWIGVWVGPSTSLDAVAKRKIHHCPQARWEDNIKMDLKEVRYEEVD